MDLSKAFDFLNHKLLIAKRYAYGFNRDSLKLINNYLSNRWQRTKTKLLGVVIDRDIRFNEYVCSLCKKDGRKLSILSKLSRYPTRVLNYNLRS